MLQDVAPAVPQTMNQLGWYIDRRDRAGLSPVLADGTSVIIGL